MAGMMKKNGMLMLSMVLSAGALLAACGDSDGEAAASVSPGKEQTASASPEKRGKIKWSVYDRGNIAASEGTVTNNRWTKWINEKGPADIEFVAIPRFESKQKFNTLFASGEAPDVINEYETAYRDQLYNQKQLLPLDDLIDKYAPNYKKLLEKYPIMRKLGTKPDGKLYEIGHVVPNAAQVIVLIRKDWLDKLSLSLPQTPDELIKVAKAFTDGDPDGNGKKDTYGYSLAYLGDEAVDAMYGNSMFIKDGKLMEDDARLAAAIAYKKRLFDEGVVDRDYLTDKNGEKSKKDWLSGKLGIYVADNNSVDMLTTLRTANPGAQVVPMLMPKTEFGQYTIRLSNPLQMTTVVYAGTKDPVAAIKAIDFIMEESTWSTLKNGVEGIHYENDANGCPRAINPDLRKVEISYAGDLTMMTTGISDNEACNIRTFDKTIPNMVDWLKIRKEARALYENPAVPLYTITHPTEHMPTLPADLQKINSDWTQQSKDIIAKAVVSGGSYTTEQAIKELQSLRQKIGQNKTMDWYVQWYNENKDTAFLTKDMYQYFSKEEY
ncbi:MAG: hypothetical protein K0R57_3495 [Paenibacillaceae bacterium]|jgi:putative aldouronate transport system substrate-binding protein|nr:hypothetical protein [Paenibacillaceae bacterium]